MNIKTEWKWLTAFGLTSLMAISLATDFTFRDLEIQKHDTYFVISAFNAIIFLTLILWSLKNLYLLVDLITDRYQILAILVAIINALIALFMFVLIYLMTHSLMVFRQTHPDRNFVVQLIPVSIMAISTAVQVIIEIRTLRKIRDFLR